MTDFDARNDFVSLGISKDYAEILRIISGSGEVTLADSVEDAIRFAKQIGDKGEEMYAFVTGAVNLVGCVLSLLVNNA